MSPFEIMASPEAIATLVTAMLGPVPIPADAPRFVWRRIYKPDDVWQEGPYRVLLCANVPLKHTFVHHQG